MPVKYDQDTKAKAIRLVREHAADLTGERSKIILSVILSVKQS